MNIVKAYQHFHPKLPEITSLKHDEVISLADNAYRLLDTIREYVYVHGLHCETDKYFGGKGGKAAVACSACTQLRNALDEV